MTRYLVQRYRQGEGAPSLSLGYSADTAALALAAHFTRYGTGVAEGTSYVVRDREADTRDVFPMQAAREIARRVR